MSRDWSWNEVEEITKDYFDMLTKEIKNIDYNKTLHRKLHQQKLSNRSGGSIEFKHQNISAVLIKFGQPYIIGYKPRGNYQQILEESVLGFIDSKDSVTKIFRMFTSDVADRLEGVDFLKWIKPVPELSILEEPEIEYGNRINKVNYLEQEQKNSILGSRGEELVIKYEKWRLMEGGKVSLADRLEFI